jgi:hypothetical protein
MLDISAIYLTFFNSNMCIVELLYWIIIFVTTKEWSLVFPQIILLTNRNVMIAITIKTRKVSVRNLSPSAYCRDGGRSWWWYRGPHRLRERNERLRAISYYCGSMLRLQLRTSH